MNERIIELADEAAKGLSGALNIPDEFCEKFAELLIQKCADIGQQYADGNYEVPNQILKYFGMEEPEE